jgi:hypothetical protein
MKGTDTIMPMQIHSPETMALAARLAFEAAVTVANEHGVALVVVVVDAAERVQYLSNMGPTMTAGALSRCAGLYDASLPPLMTLNAGTGGVAPNTGVAGTGGAGPIDGEF